MENESSMNQFIVIIGMLGAAILVGSIMTQVLGVVRTSSSGIVVSSVSNETNSWPSSPYSFSLDYDEVVSGTDKVYWKNTTSDESVLLTRGADYTIDETNGAVNLICGS